MIVDNLDAGFIGVGNWDESGAYDEFMASSLATFSPNDSAVWTPALNSAGLYDVFYWIARSTRDGGSVARSAAVKYVVMHGGSMSAVVVDQNRSTSGAWNSLGRFLFDAQGGEHVILLASGAGYETGSASADAFRLVLQSAETNRDVVIDNLDLEFTVEGSWLESAALDEYRASSVYTLASGGVASWSLRNEGPGVYRVYIWNSGELSAGRRIARNTSARYTIVHSGGSSTVVLDQNQQTGQWVPLGEFEFQGDEAEKISVLSGGNSTVADAVRLVKMR